MVEWRARARVRAVSASDWGAPSNDPPRIDLTRRRGPSRVALDFFYFLLYFFHQRDRRWGKIKSCDCPRSQMRQRTR